MNHEIYGPMGAEIGVDSPPGVGSTFWFSVLLHDVTTSTEKYLETQKNGGGTIV